MLEKIILHKVFEGFKITQDFGLTDFAKENNTYYPKGGHTGIDYGVPIGTPIRAAHSGFITQDADIDTSGKGIYIVIVDPAQLISTHYYHLLRNCIDYKAFVNKGEIIGWSGNSGLSTGPHLHFGIRIVDAFWHALNEHDDTNGFVNPLDLSIIEWREI
jgi:murein DD-endopeptidase MepM/ murein hydrolase activator NlpD